MPPPNQMLTNQQKSSTTNTSPKDIISLTLPLAFENKNSDWCDPFQLFSSDVLGSPFL